MTDEAQKQYNDLGQRASVKCTRTRSELKRTIVPRDPCNKMVCVQNAYNDRHGDGRVTLAVAPAAQLLTGALVGSGVAVASGSSSNTAKQTVQVGSLLVASALQSETA